MMECLKKIADELKSVSVNEMYHVIIEYGEEMEPFPGVFMTEENKVKGCINKAYIYSELKNGKIYYNGHSESKIVNGYIAILIKCLNGLRREEIKKTKKNIEKFLERINIQANLTPSRANAFGNIYQLMIDKANI